MTSVASDGSILISIGAGILLSLIIIAVNGRTGDVNVAQSSTKPDNAAFQTDTAVAKVELTPEEKQKVKRKLLKVQNLLGISENDIDKVIESPNDIDIDGLSWIKILEWLIFIALIVAGGYFLNLSTNGEFGHILLGLFPREIETLNLREYFERGRGHDAISSAIKTEL